MWLLHVWLHVLVYYALPLYIISALFRLSRWDSLTEGVVCSSSLHSHDLVHASQSDFDLV